MDTIDEQEEGPKTLSDFKRIASELDLPDSDVVVQLVEESFHAGWKARHQTTQAFRRLDPDSRAAAGSTTDPAIARAIGDECERLREALEVERRLHGATQQVCSETLDRLEATEAALELASEQSTLYGYRLALQDQALLARGERIEEPPVEIRLAAAEARV